MARHTGDSRVDGSGRACQGSVGAPKTRLWIDTDAGVDDALAIALALAQPNVELAGISVVRGNVDVAQGLLNVARVLLASDGVNPAAAAAVPAVVPAGVAAAGGSCDDRAFEGGAPPPPPSQMASSSSKLYALSSSPSPSSCSWIQSQPEAQSLSQSETQLVARSRDTDRSLTPPAFVVGGVQVYGGANSPLAMPPQPLSYYYGRDGLGDVPGLAPSKSLAARRALGPLGLGLGRGVTTPEGHPARVAPDCVRDGGGGGSADEGSDDWAAGALGGQKRVQNAAAAALVAAARADPGQLIVVALGPLTNVALALRLEPQLPSLVRTLLVLGGGEGEYGGNVTPYAEFNFHADPEAASEVILGFGGTTDSVCTDRRTSLDCDPRVALVTWRCCQHNLLPWVVVEALTGGAGAAARSAVAAGASGSAGEMEDATEGRPNLRGRFLAGILAPFLERWRLESPAGMLLGDPLAAALAAGMQQQQQTRWRGSGSGPDPWVSTGPPPGPADVDGGGHDLSETTFGPLVLDYCTAPCRVELQGERRGACVYGAAARYGSTCIGDDASRGGSHTTTAERKLDADTPYGFGGGAASCGDEAAAFKADRGGLGGHPGGGGGDDRGSDRVVEGEGPGGRRDGPGEGHRVQGAGGGAAALAEAAAAAAAADEDSECAGAAMAVVAVVRSIDMAAVAEMVLRATASTAGRVA